MSAVSEFKWVNKDSKFTTKGFAHLLKRIGGLIELNDYNVKSQDIEDARLGHHLQNYFDYLDGLKKAEEAIYQFLEKEASNGDN